VRTFSDVSSRDVSLSEKFNPIKIKLTNEDYARSCQKYSSTNDTGLLFDAWQKKNGEVTGEEGDFWRMGLGSKTKDCTHHILQICAINVQEKREFFM
jgi:hypothetical protein